jgi:uncharacterized lipoprotein (TIGR02269 family)
MRTLRAVWLSLFAVSLLACSTVTPPYQQQWDGAEAECSDAEEDACVTLLCGDDACGFYRCEDVPGEVLLARFPPARPPAAAAAPGSGPQRNWGSGMNLPGGGEPIFVIPWHPEPRPIPPQRQLPAGRFEKHHIFPQAKELARWFSEQGVRIHDYTLPLPRDVHLRIHRGEAGGPWNEAWLQFKDARPNASPVEIFKHAGELIYRFQLLGGPIQKYSAHSG